MSSVNEASSATFNREQGTAITAGEMLATIRRFQAEFPSRPDPLSFRYEMPIIETPFLDNLKEETVGHELVEVKAHPLAAFFLRAFGKSDHVMWLQGKPIVRMVEGPIYFLNTYRPMFIGPIGMYRMLGAAV